MTFIGWIDRTQKKLFQNQIEQPIRAISFLFKLTVHLRINKALSKV